MKATELRIGNFITFQLSGSQMNYSRVCRVLKIYEDTCIVLDKGLDLELFYRSSHTKPIPLDPIWLKRFGFETVVRSWIWFESPLMPISLKKKHDGYAACFIYKSHRPEIAIIKYVHQLQNLYFALTGSELTDKEKKI